MLQKAAIPRKLICENFSKGISTKSYTLENIPAIRYYTVARNSYTGTLEERQTETKKGRHTDPKYKQLVFKTTPIYRSHHFVPQRCRLCKGRICPCIEATWYILF